MNEYTVKFDSDCYCLLLQLSPHNTAWEFGDKKPRVTDQIENQINFTQFGGVGNPLPLMSWYKKQSLSRVSWAVKAKNELILGQLYKV